MMTMNDDYCMAKYCELEDIGFQRQLTEKEKEEINRLRRIIYG
jgi:hypothetical protein